MNTEEWKDRLLALRVETEEALKTAGDSTRPVELDQTSVGQLTPYNSRKWRWQPNGAAANSSAESTLPLGASGATTMDTAHTAEKKSRRHV